jgi:protease-4
MRFFFKTVAANLVAILITLFVLGMAAFVGLIILVKVAAGSAHHETAVHDKSVLVFDMDVAITDAPEHGNPGDLLNVSSLASGGAASRLTVYEIVNAIAAAAKDPKIVALYMSGSLDTDNAASGYAALLEVRQAIERFKDSGKKVYAYLEEPTVKDYYLASVANEISLNPFGVLSINGLSAESFYLHDALEKYGVGVQVTRVGKYKSYVEMFTENHMSDADREQLTQLLGGIWGNVEDDLAASRKLDVNVLKKLANTPGVFLATDAVKDKLVDKLAYLDQIIDKLKDVGAYDEDNDTFYQVALSTYANRLETKRIQAAKTTFKSSDKIAIVYAEGDIVDGGGGSDSVGGDDLSSTLREVRGDDDVKAVVLRVNSPGGSVLASEIIQREIVKLREEKKPVVVSMGTYAASGGYWISTYSDYIFAEPTTVTGSIGVFGLKFNIQDIANQHGVAFDGVKTAPFADLDTMTRPWTPDEQKLAQTLVDNIYDQFISKVSEGRKLTKDQVGEIAQGRVWSGADAKKLGLVDAMGGLGDAIKKAADLAKLKDNSWSIEEYPEKQSPLDALVQAISQGNEPPPVSKLGLNLNAAIPGHDPLSTSLRELQTQWRFVRTFNDPRGLYARLPFLLNF